jgi:hypothetical protein
MAHRRGSQRDGGRWRRWGKTCKASVKHPLDGPSSCTRMCRTLGHTLPVTRTTEERTHWCAAKVVGEMRCRGQRGGACAIKTRAKAL